MSPPKSSILVGVHKLPGIGAMVMEIAVTGKKGENAGVVIVPEDQLRAVAAALVKEADELGV